MATITLTEDKCTLLKSILEHASQQQVNMAKAMSGADFRYPDGTIPSQEQIDAHGLLAAAYEDLSDDVAAQC